MKELRNGLSGIMCIKNEARFLRDCIESCIGALDELVVVYIKGADNTESILKSFKQRYPNKIFFYSYPYDVLWFDMSIDEYNYAKELPENDPRLYSSMCNFALSKVNYKYVIKKIDADQFYFHKELKHWRDVCGDNTIPSWSLAHLIGFFYSVYISLYRRISALAGKPLIFLLPEIIAHKLYKYYKLYSQRELKCNRAAISLSGLNVFKDDEWFVPFDGVNIHPPYNGNGDHIIFPISEETYFYKHNFNRAENRKSYSITEDFFHPYRVFIGGVCWFHQHANRVSCWSFIKEQKKQSPEDFVPIEQFLMFSNKKYLAKMNGKINVMYNKIYFSIVHIISKNEINKNKDKLYKCNV